MSRKRLLDDAQRVLRQELESWGMDVNSIRTAPDLYETIVDVGHKHRSSARSLEHYLRTLWQIGREYHERSSLNWREVVQLLSNAFTGPTPPFDKTWQFHQEVNSAAATGFAGWEGTVLRQVVDLHQMEQQGTLAEKWLDATSSPRGHRWANFGPCSYLECAAAGTVAKQRAWPLTWEDFREFLILGQVYE